MKCKKGSRAKYLAEYQRKNRKKIAKQKAEYQRKNHEKVAKYKAAWCRKNAKRIAKQKAEYRRRNRKKFAKWDAARYRKNKKKILKQVAAYQRKNRKKIAEYLTAHGFVYRRKITARHTQMLSRHKRQLLPRDIKGQPMSLESHRKKLYFVDGRERPCWYCHGENNKCGSGLDRLDNNVTYTVKNTVPCCRGCNTWRGSTHSVQQTRDHFKPMRDAARESKGESK